MTRRLLVGYLGITVLVLLMLEIPLAVFYGQREEDHLISQAGEDAVVLASFYEDALDAGATVDAVPAEDYAARTGARVVLVDADGVSLLDTEASVPRDFSTRPEMATALSGVRSAGIRRSDSLDTDLLYVAVPVASGGSVHGALRVTLDAHEVTDRIHRFWLALVVVAVVVLSAVLAIGWAVARSITRPIRSLQRAALRFSDGDLTPAPVDPDAPPELADLASSLNTMAERLDDLMARQRAFVGDASHQLRTPLTALGLRLENLESQLDDEASVAECAAAIVELERLGALVDDLLAMARVERQLTTRPVDLAAIAGERVDTWGAVAAEHGVRIVLHAAPGSPSATAASGVVEQLIDNAIDNALRFSPDGSVIDLRIAWDDRTVELMVCDHGVGLSDEAKVRAVERFWRGDPAGDGSGLGLSIAQSLTRAVGGDLVLSDTDGGGLTVTYSFRRA